MAENFKNKLFLKVGLTLGMLAVFVIANIFVQFEIRRKVGEISQGRQELTARSQAITSLAILKKEAEEAERYTGILNNLLPKNESLIDFRRDLRTLAADEKLTFTFSFGADTPGDASRPGLIGFQAAIGGELQKFQEFLKAIEAMNYFVSFDALEFMRSGSRFSGSLGGKVYYQ